MGVIEIWKNDVLVLDETEEHFQPSVYLKNGKLHYSHRQVQMPDDNQLVRCGF
jgi:hypothetical protein